VMCENGTGLERDLGRAVKFYEIAADAGLMAAQYNLGVLYAMGNGVEMNHARARELFEKAAAQGHDLATENLRTMEEAEQAASADDK